MLSTSQHVSVIVLSWNRRDALYETLRKLSPYGHPSMEIVVVDNGSTDGSVKMIREEFPSVSLIALPANIGIEALNKGISASQGEIIVLLDDDSYPLPGAIEGLMREFAADPSLGIAACQILGPPEWDAAWPWKDVPSGATVNSFVGCGVGIRRAALDRAGLFDGAFFLYVNEVDLAVRVMGAGYTVRYFPEIKFVHAVSPTNRSNLRSEYYTTRNILWIIWKYFPPLESVQLTTRTVFGRLAHRIWKRDLARSWVAARAAWDALTLRGRRGPGLLLPPSVRQELRMYIDRWYPAPWRTVK